MRFLAAFALIASFVVLNAAELDEIFSESNSVDQNAIDFSLNGRPAVQVAANRKPLLCYYGSWATYRPGNGKFDVEHLDPNVCTHIVYGFAGLGNDNRIKALDGWNDLPDNYGKNGYGRFVGLKKRNPNLKVLLAIGGWNEGSVKYSQMVANPSARRVFIQSVVQMLSKHGFDGLDLDWEYPANRGGSPQDKQNFGIFLRELRTEFNRHGYLMTAAVGAGKAVIDSAYDVPAMSRYLDFINVMAYDYHGGWDGKAGHNAPLKPMAGDNPTISVDYSIRYWIQKGASPRKLLLGIGTYGRSFAVSSTGLARPGSPSSGPGTAGPYTREPGTLGYNEICESMITKRWLTGRDNVAGVPYAQDGTTWVSYDDVTSVAQKARYANRMGLGGAMIWSIETDDSRGACGQGRFPLVRSIRRALDSNAVRVNLSEDNADVSEPVPSEPESNDVSQEQPSNQPSSDSNASECTQEGTFRSGSDCSHFIQCVKIAGELRKFEKTCPSGTVFDNNSKVCNWANLVTDCKA